MQNVGTFLSWCGEALAVFGEVLRYQGDEFFETANFSIGITDEAKADAFTLTAFGQPGVTKEESVH